MLNDGAQLAVGRARHLGHLPEFRFHHALELGFEKLLQFPPGIPRQTAAGLQADDQPAGFELRSSSL